MLFCKHGKPIGECDRAKCQAEAKNAAGYCPNFPACLGLQDMNDKIRVAREMAIAAGADPILYDTYMSDPAKYSVESKSTEGQ